MNKQYSFPERDLRLVIDDSVAAAEHGKEVVGIIVDHGYYLELVLCKNKSRRKGSFSFYYSEVRSIVAAAKRLGHEAIGTFHSHPAGLAEPGESDVANASDNTLMLIIDCIKRGAALWWIKRYKARKLSYLGLQLPHLSPR
jgi:proteasome lid subunit RPN8/RPN11